MAYLPRCHAASTVTSVNPRGKALTYPEQDAVIAALRILGPDGSTVLAQTIGADPRTVRSAAAGERVQRMTARALLAACGTVLANHQRSAA